MKKAWEIENPVAVVYRKRYGCSKEYVFESVDDLATWCARKAYQGETLYVIPVKDKHVLGRKDLPVEQAAQYVREAIGG